LVLAQEAAVELSLEEVLLVPTGVAPHKRIEPDPGLEVRLEMAHRAAAGVATLSVSELETARQGPSYTYRTLELLLEERPDADLVLLLGADAAVGLESWRKPERIVELARLGIAERAGIDRGAVESVIERLGATGDGAGREATFIAMPQIGISSSAIRARVGKGLPIRFLVPDAVAELIAERGLYGG
jgi:nicotinate-nucleotide adenylyltransferase